MKLYRSVPILEQQKIDDTSIDAASEGLEAAYLMHGYCAPSTEFIKYGKNPRANLNTFAYNDLAKYFYPSLLDAIKWAYSLSKTKKMQGKFNSNYLRWEIDVPDSMVKDHIGVGEYSTFSLRRPSEYRIEVKIPYWILASYLGYDLDPNFISQIEMYFSNHYCLPNLSSAEQKEFLQKINNPQALGLLKSSSGTVLQTYDALSFSLFMPYGLLQMEGETQIEDVCHLAYEAKDINHSQWLNKLKYNYFNWSKVGHGEVADYLQEECAYLQEENTGIKRTLKQNGHTFR